MWEKINKVYIGVIAGVVIPLILYVIFYHEEIKRLSYFAGASEKFIFDALPILLTRCIFPNALIFFFFVWQNKLRVGKGLLISTAALTGALVIINFVL